MYQLGLRNFSHSKRPTIAYSGIPPPLAGTHCPAAVQDSSPRHVAGVNSVKARGQSAAFLRGQSLANMRGQSSANLRPNGPSGNATPSLLPVVCLLLRRCFAVLLLLSEDSLVFMMGSFFSPFSSGQFNSTALFEARKKARNEGVEGSLGTMG